MITSIYGKSNVVTFRQTAASVIDEFYCNPRPKDTEEERYRIIETAAKLIKSEIKNVDVSSDVYPTSAVMSDVEEALKFIPDLLKSFHELLFVGKDIKLMLASVGQAVVQAVRPRDGTGTFHGMGIFAAITPGTKATIPIPLRKVSAEDIAKVGRIEIRPFIGPLKNTPLLTLSRATKYNCSRFHCES